MTFFASLKKGIFPVSILEIVPKSIRDISPRGDSGKISTVVLAAGRGCEVTPNSGGRFGSETIPSRARRKRGTTMRCRCGNEIHNVPEHLQALADWRCQECSNVAPQVSAVSPESNQLNRQQPSGHGKRAA